MKRAQETHWDVRNCTMCISNRHTWIRKTAMHILCMENKIRELKMKHVTETEKGQEKIFVYTIFFLILGWNLKLPRRIEQLQR